MRIASFVSVSLLICLVASNAFAHPGSHSLTCKSVNKQNAQSVEFSLKRSNSTGWFAPIFNLSLGNKEYIFSPSDETKSYGQTIHDTPIGLIYITADNRGDGEKNQGHFSLKAIPNSVKSDHSNWNFEEEKAPCYDASAKASFQGIFSGSVLQENGKWEDLEPVLMDCDLEYNSGMAC